MMKQICHKLVVHLTAWDAWSKWAAQFPLFLVLGHNKWAALLPVYYFGSRQQVFGKKNCSSGASNHEPRGIQVGALPLHYVTFRVVGKYSCYLYLF
jgi:hypothetical protein